MRSIIGALLLYQSYASFLQCSPSDSLETLDDLQDSGRAVKQGIICPEWPFYSGGFGKHHGYYSSSSSSSSSWDSGDSSDDRDDAPPSLLPPSVTEDSVLYGFEDAVEMTHCVANVDGRCSAWVTSKKQYEEKKHEGCHYHKDKDTPPAIINEYQLCRCAEYTDAYCATWACLETAEMPEQPDAYSLTNDNSFMRRHRDSHSHGYGHGSGSRSRSRSGSSESVSMSSEDSSEEEFSGNYYRFAHGGKMMELDESMEFSNCWCKQASANGQYCLNWYCQSLEHDEHGCHGKEFGVEDYGWFGCYDDSSNVNDTQCTQWYGYLTNHDMRHEYRCECSDETCLASVCGLKEIPRRRNWMWYNFPLAMLIWGCCFGCCGTKICYRKPFTCSSRCLRWLRCRKCRMFVFYALVASFAMIHGGFPAFVLTSLLFTCSLGCAYKCEKCGCCRSKCGMKKWKKQCEMQCQVNATVETDAMVTDKDGEASKEDSESHDADAPTGKMNKSGHVRVTSIDLDELEMMDGEETKN